MIEETGHSAGAGSSDHAGAHSRKSPPIIYRKVKEMKVEDVLTLARAGFSSAQIAQMASEETVNTQPPKTPEVPEAPSVPAQKSTEQDKSPKGPEAIPVSQATPVPTPQVSKTDEILKGITQELASLKQSIHTQNIQNSQQPAKESVESILASIISPTYKHSNKEE